MNNKKSIIEFKNVTFKYLSQQEPTLKDVSFKIFKGEKVLILGVSGSGKSTVGHLINGLIPAFYKGEVKGSIIIDGEDIKGKQVVELSKKIGTVLQDTDGQFVALTVAEDIAFALENDCVGQDEMTRRVAEIAGITDTACVLGHSPQNLSGGQKQRVSLSGVLIDNTPILLFDEPLANLDPATGKSAIAFIDDMQNRMNHTVIIIEHRLEDVLYRNVDRIILMNQGRVIQNAAPNELLSGTLLKEYGLREPLYLTALKYAGVEVAPEMNPQDINTMDLSKCAGKLIKWANGDFPQADAFKTENILEVNNLSFAYSKGRNAVSGLSFTLKKGEILSVVGKNGAGKSTVSKLLCGFEAPSGGKILYRGHDIASDTIKERANYIGLVMQNPNHMISKQLIFDEVALGLKNRGFTADEIKERAEAVLKVCGLYPFRNWPVQALSYGQKKRVTIASILVLQPEILILDEPTAGQDYRHYTDIMEFILNLNKTIGISIIIITHDMHLMLEYSNRCIVMLDGEKVADLEPYQVLTDTAIIEKANLKETSLFTLAKRCNVDKPKEFVNSFIKYERAAGRKVRVDGEAELI